ncbi:MAG: crotonase/enoyl-CoA hydratase family protein [Myxococcota bacterium]
MTQPVRYVLQDRVAVISIDDGKANALSPAVLTGLAEALDWAESNANAVVIAGRKGRFCAGFDLKLMTSGPKAAGELVKSGAELLMRLYEHPQPVVIACTGHAMAGGAVMLLCADVRIGASGDFKIGLNEVAIGMPMPVFVSELARERLERRALVLATLGASIVDPATAAEIGFLDRVVDEEEVRDAAFAEAARLAKLPKAAYASTKRSIRSPVIAHIRATFEDDLARVIQDFGIKTG